MEPIAMEFLKRHSPMFGWTFVLLAVGTAAFFAGAPVTRAAFGSSPPFINPDHLVAGSTYTQTIYLVQDQPNQDTEIKVALNVPDSIASWISIDKGTDFVIPAGTHQFPVQVTIKVPSDAGLGKYSGTIVFTTTPTASGQVTIALGASVALNLTVGTGIYESFTVPLITIPDIEEGWNPQVYVKFENDGNVPEAFDSATFTLFDQYDGTQLAYLQKQDSFPATPAFTTNEYTLEFPTSFHLGIGQYWGNVVFYQNGKVIASQKAIFHVLKAGSILGTWGRVSYFLSHNESSVIAIGAFIAIVIILLIIWGVRRRRKASKAHHRES